ncbi:MAG: hypothetical protein PHT59_06605 [Candidatus Omnitrophica bacterium]|nr:hypothetical protein [Candidatus Omnitrophota bacterium]
MTDHCHIEIRIELYNQFKMSENGEGERISKRIEEAANKILANEGFFPHDYFISKSVMP